MNSFNFLPISLILISVIFSYTVCLIFKLKLKNDIEVISLKLKNDIEVISMQLPKEIPTINEEIRQEINNIKSQIAGMEISRISKRF